MDTRLNRLKIRSNATYWELKRKLQEFLVGKNFVPLPITLLSALGGKAFWCSLKIT
jgi:hypothetical protein